MIKNTIAAVVIIAVLIFLVRLAQNAPSPVPESEQTSSIYTNVKYGFSFIIPVGYTITERSQGNAEREHYIITLTKDEDAVIPENGEGPTSISIDIYQNEIDQMSLASWFHGTNDSNSKLTANQSYASTTIAGKEAISYRWSGLYEGETVAFEHDKNIVALSVTYMDTSDRNLTAFRKLTSSLLLEKRPPTN